MRFKLPVQTDDKGSQGGLLQKVRIILGLVCISLLVNCTFLASPVPELPKPQSMQDVKFILDRTLMYVAEKNSDKSINYGVLFKFKDSAERDSFIKFLNTHQVRLTFLVGNKLVEKTMLEPTLEVNSEPFDAGKLRRSENGYEYDLSELFKGMDLPTLAVIITWKNETTSKVLANRITRLIRRTSQELDSL